jgi:hypothetical protein
MIRVSNNSSPRPRRTTQNGRIRNRATIESTYFRVPGKSIFLRNENKLKKSLQYPLDLGIRLTAEIGNRFT